MFSYQRPSVEAVAAAGIFPVTSTKALGASMPPAPLAQEGLLYSVLWRWWEVAVLTLHPLGGVRYVGVHGGDSSPLDPYQLPLRRLTRQRGQTSIVGKILIS